MDLLMQHSLNYKYCAACDKYGCEIYSSKLMFFDQSYETEAIQEQWNMPVSKPQVSEILKIASRKCRKCLNMIPTPLAKLHTLCPKCIRGSSKMQSISSCHGYQGPGNLLIYCRVYGVFDKYFLTFNTNYLA